MGSVIATVSTSQITALPQLWLWLLAQSLGVVLVFEVLNRRFHFRICLIHDVGAL